MSNGGRSWPVTLHGPLRRLAPLLCSPGGGAFFAEPKGEEEARAVWQARRVSSGNVVRRTARRRPRAGRAETAARVNEWLASPGLQPPK